MKDLVSTGVLAFVSSLSVIWVAGSIFVIPDGFPALVLGWASLAYCSALWVGMSSTGGSMAQLLQDVEAEPRAALKPRRFAAPTWMHVAWVSLLPVLLFAETPAPGANLSACKSGSSSCERSRLTLVEMTELARAERTRNVSRCRNGLNTCEPSNLTKAEAIAVEVANYDRNVSDCMAGRPSCDPSRLTPSEARDTAAAAHQRREEGDHELEVREAGEVGTALPTGNMANCREGRDSCDYYLLSWSEAQAIAGAERVRNYAACRTHRGYCDRSRLTPAEAALIPREAAQ